jgi:hypothetical protein
LRGRERIYTVLDGGVPDRAETFEIDADPAVCRRHREQETIVHA